MVRLEGTFRMGSETPAAFLADGEGPVRQVSLTAFYISSLPSPNAQFAEFARQTTGYRTEAERFGWSFVFRNHVPPHQRVAEMPGTLWWVRVNGADWRHPEGPESSIGRRSDYPVVHVCGTMRRPGASGRAIRSPTEAEWEFAARGGLDQQTYPWGNELMPGGRHGAIWQGQFPDLDLGEDGFRHRSLRPAASNRTVLDCTTNNTKMNQGRQEHGNCRRPDEEPARA